ncbi:uncharacterized protein [Phaseolus vulgaris]|uniref:uncharacterized protein n=1 Tax=Phaseolus vulgaris TaxID=3885 RepID=UPI0035CA1F0E
MVFQKGVIEPLMDMVRSMLSKSTVPISLWMYALKTAMYLLNRVPSKAVQKTHFELWTGRKPSLRHLHVWGCQAEVRIYNPQEKKLDARTTSGCFIESENELGIDNDPVSFSDAINDNNSDKWLDAMKDELKSMTQNDETFSPVSKKESFRIIMALVAHYDLKLHQMDVKTAFLNGDLEEHVYVDQPASRQWYLKFNDTIVSFGFKENIIDRCIYLKVSGSKFIFLILYVDDILLATNDLGLFSETKKFLSNNFEMKDMGEIQILLVVWIHEKSTFGYVYLLAGEAISLKSAKQTVIDASTMEAEFVACFEATVQANWLRNFVSGLGIVDSMPSR